MTISSRLRFIALIALLTVAACASDRDIQTPVGPVSGQVAGQFIVLGVAFKATSTGNRPNAGTVFRETVDLDVPAGTEVIVPALTGWDIGFGSTDPEDLSPQAAPESVFNWRATDHHYGWSRVGVVVRDIDALAPGATTQRARIEVQATLTDNNLDDPWWGVIRYQLIFLGRHPTP